MLTAQSVVLEPAASASRESWMSGVDSQTPTSSADSDFCTWTDFQAPHAPVWEWSVFLHRMSCLNYGSDLALYTWDEMDLAVPGPESCLPTPHVPVRPTLLCYLGQWQCPCSGTAAAPQPQTLSPAVITCCSLSCRLGGCWTRNPPSSPGNCGFL